MATNLPAGACFSSKIAHSLERLSISWVLRNKIVTSALIGARNVKQLNECLDSLNNLSFTKEELKKIDKYAKDEDINLWAKSSKY